MSSPGTAKPVRKDAARNRARLVQAAREVFAERGLDATLDDIARHAGVGTGTAYRHFANKQEIAAEVLAHAIQQMVTDAENALLINDPWAGLATFFETTAARQAVDRGLHQALMGQGNRQDRDRIWPQLVSAVSLLFARAKSAGAIRADAEPTDAVPIFAMLGVAFDMSTATSADLWRRYLALLLDGLRATDRPVISVSALALNEIDAAIAASKRTSAGR
jgi:AcrR family transcriptional regulator